MSAHDHRPRRGKRIIPVHFRAPEPQSNVVVFERPLPAADARPLPGRHVRFVDATLRSGVQTFDLTAWSPRPQIAEAVAKYLTEMGEQNKAGTRLIRHGKLNVFRTYLDAQWPQVVALRDITPEVLSGYIAWLSRGYSKDRSGASKPWHDSTKRGRYSALVAFLRFCRRRRRLTVHLHPDLSLTGMRPWSDARPANRPRRALTNPELRCIVEACLKEIDETVRRLKIGVSVRADEGMIVPPAGEPSVTKFKKFSVKLRTLIVRHKDCIPSGAQLRKLDRGLFRALRTPYGTSATTGSYLHFTPRRLVPFVLLLAAQTTFNPEVLLNLTWSNVEKSHDIRGADRWTIFGRKGRSSRLQSRSFSGRVKASGHAVVLLKLLWEFGEAARRAVPREQERIRDRVFLFLQVRAACFATFESDQGASGSKAWTYNLRAFIEEHRLILAPTDGCSSFGISFPKLGIGSIPAGGSRSFNLDSKRSKRSGSRASRRKRSPRRGPWSSLFPSRPSSDLMSTVLIHDDSRERADRLPPPSRPNPSVGLDGHVEDDVWRFKNTTDGASSIVTLDWLLVPPREGVLTPEAWEELVYTAKLFLFSLTRHNARGRPVKVSGLEHKHELLVYLLRWMNVSGRSRFADLDRDAAWTFRDDLAEDKGVFGTRPARTVETLAHYLDVLCRLYEQGGWRMLDFPGSAMPEPPFES